MDIVDLIKDDHEQVATLMEKLSTTTEEDTDDRETLFNELRSALEAHTQAEERIVYERLEDEDTMSSIIAESYEEHTLVAELLQSLSEMEFNHEEWGDKFAVLRENVEHHVEEEESEVLPYLADAVNDDEREEMADDMKTLEDEIMSAGPESVTQTPAQSILGTNI
jgi:hemerythrin superfamily protein